MGKESRFKVLTILLVSCLFLTSCSLSGRANELSSENAAQTAIAQTVVALQTQMAVNATPILPALPTQEQSPSATPTAKPTAILPTVQALPTSTPLPVYKVGNVVDLNYADNTVVDPGESFTKTWRITNTGTATWNANFKLVFISGDAMSGSSKTIGKSVSPGGTIDLSVNLTAPSTPKTYQGYWMLQTDGGKNFGFGDEATSPFWVKIVVSKAFAVTNAVPAYTLPSSYTCPVQISLTAAITATTSGTVTYYFNTSMGKTATYEMAFSEGGTITSSSIADSIVIIPTSGTVTVSLYIDNPNHQDFPTVLSIPITCP